MNFSDLFVYHVRRKRQARVLKWATDTFGVIAATRLERSQRFIEEAIELAQALHVDKATVLRLVDYVYARPVGNAFQEVGGVSLTLLALCEVLDITAENCEQMEFERVLKADPEKFRMKQNSKAAAGVGEATRLTPP